MAGYGLNMVGKPVYKIETYTGVTLDHTITQEARDIMVKETLTENIGTFSFTVPTKKGGSYKFDDIALFDKVKIWFGYGSISGNPLTVGRIYEITGPVSTEQGYIRIIKGRNQGERLQRRLKGMKDWDAVDASVIVTELATDIGLGTTEIETDTTDETHRIDIDKHERYDEFLRKVSDYWYNAGTQVKKDFYVDIDNNLVWKSRPIRSVGVESFTIGGKNVISYTALRDLSSVKNKIYVYGAKLKAYNDDRDFGTDMVTPYTGSTVDQESASGQKNLYVADTNPFSATDTIYIYYSDRVEENVVASIDAGVKLVCENNLANTYPVASGVIVYPGWGPTSSSTAIATDAVTKIVGSRSIKITGSDGGGWCGAMYKPSATMNCNYFPSVNFYVEVDSGVSGYVRFQDTAGKYGEKVFLVIPDDSEFHFVSLPCGRDNEDGWVMDSGFDWTTLYTVEIAMHDGTMNYWLDGLFINHRRFSNTAEDSGSQSDYGVREMMHVDDALQSDADCQRRGQSLLYRLKDPPIRVDVESQGNNNILIGDRVPLTIPAENISAVDFDIVTVINRMNQTIGWRTYSSMVNSGNMRRLPPRNRDEILVQKFAAQREIGRGVNELG